MIALLDAFWAWLFYGPYAEPRTPGFPVVRQRPAAMPGARRPSPAKADTAAG